MSVVGNTKIFWRDGYKGARGGASCLFLRSGEDPAFSNARTRLSQYQRNPSSRIFVYCTGIDYRDPSAPILRLIAHLVIRKSTRVFSTFESPDNPYRWSTAVDGLPRILPPPDGQKAFWGGMDNAER